MICTQPPRHDVRGRRILIAEDDACSRLHLVHILLQMGLRPRAARTGRHLLRLFAEGGAAVMLLDYHLPDMPAPALIQQLRQERIRQEVPPIIVLSAGISPGQGLQLQQMAVRHILDKPIDTQALQELLTALLPPWLYAEDALPPHRPAAQTARLRSLLADELGEWERRMPELACRPTQLLEWLHRLHASCALCGAPSLGQQAAAMETRLRRGKRLSDSALQALQHQIRQTRQALTGIPGPVTSDGISNRPPDLQADAGRSRHRARPKDQPGSPRRPPRN